MVWYSILFKNFPQFVVIHTVKGSSSEVGEAEAEIKIAGRNVNNLRYADVTTLVAESEEELKNLWIMVKEESVKADLRLIIKNTKIMASGPITSW